jgi:hypothetical protein
MPMNEPQSHMPPRALFRLALELPREQQREFILLKTAGDHAVLQEFNDLLRHLDEAAQSEHQNRFPLPTEPINNCLRAVLSEHAYVKYVEPPIEDLRHEYSTQKVAGDHWKARWCLIRAYSILIFPFMQSLVAMLYRLYKLI